MATGMVSGFKRANSKLIARFSSKPLRECDGPGNNNGYNLGSLNARSPL